MRWHLFQMSLLVKKKEKASMASLGNKRKVSVMIIFSEEKIKRSVEKYTRDLLIIL